MSARRKLHQRTFDENAAFRGQNGRARGIIPPTANPSLLGGAFAFWESFTFAVD
jgi:hypothetical protein